MGNFLDILTGRIFNFKVAAGADVNAGTSDKLIITPKALSGSDVFCNTSIPLVLPASLSAKSSAFTTSDYFFNTPVNGFFFPNRKSIIKTQLFCFTMADSGGTGEICLQDVITGATVPGSTFSFKNISWANANSAVFEIEAGKMYTIAIRRSAGTGNKAVQLRSAILTLKLQSN